MQGIENDDMNGERIARFISGQCSAEERSSVQAWIDGDPSRRDLVTSLEEIWRLTGTADRSWDVDASWNAFQGRRAATGTSLQRMSRGRPSAMAWLVRAAAILAIVAGGALAWNRIARDSQPGEIIAQQEFVTPSGEQRDLRLPDGTVVTLGPDSRLQVDAAFGRDAREIRLDGQAVFNVTHQAELPFRVHAGEVVTEVLGTRFVVRAYTEDAETVVALAEGSIRLSARDDVTGERTLVLRPGQVARAASGALQLDVGADIKRYLEWTEGRLVFSDTRLDQAARELSRWYGVDIRLDGDSLGERRLTASFQDEPIDEVANLVALSLNLRYERSGREIVISAR